MSEPTGKSPIEPLRHRQYRHIVALVEKVERRRRVAMRNPARMFDVLENLYLDLQPPNHTLPEWMIAYLPAIREALGYEETGDAA